MGRCQFPIKVFTLPPMTLLPLGEREEGTCEFTEVEYPCVCPTGHTGPHKARLPDGTEIHIHNERWRY